MSRCRTPSDRCAKGSPPLPAKSTGSAGWRAVDRSIRGSQIACPDGAAARSPSRRGRGATAAKDVLAARGRGVAGDELAGVHAVAAVEAVVPDVVDQVVVAGAAQRDVVAG